jgi:hypothetical protein
MVANFDSVFVLGPPGLSSAGLATTSKAANMFPVGVFATGKTVGVQGISLGNFGDVNSLPDIGPVGVYGGATTSPGVTGWSKENDGCQGLSFTGTAIRAASFFGPGIDSLSGALTGVRGVSEMQGPPVPNTSNIAGVVGSSNQQHGVIGTSNAAVGVIGFSNNIGVQGYGAVAGQFIGDLQVTGTKAAVVPFPDGTHRALYCMESPELWFEDFGTANSSAGAPLCTSMRTSPR